MCAVVSSASRHHLHSGLSAFPVLYLHDSDLRYTVSEEIATGWESRKTLVLESSSMFFGSEESQRGGHLAGFAQLEPRLGKSPKTGIMRTTIGPLLPECLSKGSNTFFLRSLCNHTEVFWNQLF
ncbi:hypothetical protein BDZ91DRAFT_760800 [Kalaharituber pfeilii]|nr:hypothetical protein BDZ91DRAFT_760800 [Kalaharituber pfeilii]